MIYKEEEKEVSKTIIKDYLYMRGREANNQTTMRDILEPTQQINTTARSFSTQNYASVLERKHELREQTTGRNIRIFFGMITRITGNKKRKRGILVDREKGKVKYRTCCSEIV